VRMLNESGVTRWASLFGTIVLVALCATRGIDARTHRALKRTAPTATVSPKITPSEAPRDPEDVAIDRRIKGICKGC
jgi:hypothetical protein